MCVRAWSEFGLGRLVRPFRFRNRSGTYRASSVRDDAAFPPENTQRKPGPYSTPYHHTLTGISPVVWRVSS